MIRFGKSAQYPKFLVIPRLRMVLDDILVAEWLYWGIAFAKAAPIAPSKPRGKADGGGGGE